MLEIEIRLSDIRSLASYGSSLLPFWVHSDRQIKLLESVINDDLLRTAKSAHDDVEDKQVPISEGLSEQQNGMEHESEVDHNEKQGGFLTSEVSNESQVDASAVVLKDIYDKVPTNAQHVPLSSSPGSHIETGVEVNTQVETTLNSEESPHKLGYNVGDDVDMDVDMEVEDINSSGNSTMVDASVATDYVQTDQPVQLHPLSSYHSMLSEDAFVVPPPPDDEWIPPPPPDSELVPPPPPPDDDQVPPPPPGDPLAPSYHALPSYTETGQSLSCPQYSLSYSGASSEYYGQTAAEVPNSNIYGQIVMPPAQIYYSAVPNMYSENSQVISNPTGPVTYYELQDGMLVLTSISVVSEVIVSLVIAVNLLILVITLIYQSGAFEFLQELVQVPYRLSILMILAVLVGLTGHVVVMFRPPLLASMHLQLLQLMIVVHYHRLLLKLPQAVPPHR